MKERARISYIIRYIRYSIAGAAIIIFSAMAKQQSARHDGQTSSVRKKTTDSYLEIRARLRTALRHQDYQSAATGYQQAGDLFFRQGAMPQALDHYLKAITYFTKGNSRAGIASSLNKAGLVYYKNAMYGKALSDFCQAEELFSRQKHLEGLAETYENKGRVYEAMNEPDSSKLLRDKALAAYRMIADNRKTAGAYAKTGNMYEESEQYIPALRYYFEALKVYRNEADSSNLPGLLNNIGDIYRKSGACRTALAYSARAERLSAKLNDQRQLSSAHRDLAKTYELLGKYDSAYFYSEKARQEYAKSYNEEATKRLNLIQTLFDVQEKDNAIVRLGQEKRAGRALAWSITFTGVLIAFSGFSLWSKQRLKNNKDRLIYEAEKKAIELELVNRKLQHDVLQDELELKGKELASHTLHIIRKNQFLEELKDKLAVLIRDNKRDQRKELKQLIHLITANSSEDKTWEDFRAIYETVHENFFEKLKQRCASLSAADLRFLALLKMNLSSSDMATMLGISQDSLRTTRYRMRKKLGLTEKEDLLSFIRSV